MASISGKLASANEATWLRLGLLSEAMHDPEKAMFSFENTLRHNPYNIKALTQIASICRLREQYPKAVEFFQRILNVENNNGEIWGALGHCYLMMDDLQKAYTAYQQALYHLPNPKDPNLWYGIGILYDRYGSFGHAEEAFTAVLKMDPKFEKSNEIYFRLGIIYKQQMKYDQALECFRFILQKPPRPLTQGDIYFQIGHVYELQKEYNSAKEAYERTLKDTPNHAKALQQLGWLYHASKGNQELAINYLMRSIDADPSDGQTWYLLGRCYMAQQQYRKAYDAYQQAVYRDGRNPTFWCSIGVLYYQINQYRDALDAYSRAIRLNPYQSEVWYDLGTLYESCNQISDSLDAYQRAAELDPQNKHIQQRLTSLRDQTLPKSGNLEAAEIKEKEKERTPMTMEPQATVSDRGSSTGSGGQTLNVPDLVDLSSDDTKKQSFTLPSPDNLNSPPFKSELAPEVRRESKSSVQNLVSPTEDKTTSPEYPASDSKEKEDLNGMEIVEEPDEEEEDEEEKEEEEKEEEEEEEEGKEEGGAREEYQDLEKVEKEEKKEEEEKEEKGVESNATRVEQVDREESRGTEESSSQKEEESKDEVHSVSEQDEKDGPTSAEKPTETSSSESSRNGDRDTEQPEKGERKRKREADLGEEGDKEDL